MAQQGAVYEREMVPILQYYEYGPISAMCGARNFYLILVLTALYLFPEILSAGLSNDW